MESFGVSALCGEGRGRLVLQDFNKECIIAYGVDVLQDCVDSVLVKMSCGRVRREIFSVKRKKMCILDEQKV